MSADDDTKGAARLALLYEVGRSFNEMIDLDELLPHVLDKSRELLETEGSAIILLDAEAHELFFSHSANVAPEGAARLRRIRFPAARGIAGWVLEHAVPQLVADVSKDPRWYAGVDEQSGLQTRSLLCAPLRTRRGTIGVIELRNKMKGSFTDDDLEFLDALTGSIAVAIENARLYRSVKESETRLRTEVGFLQRDLVSHHRFTDIVSTSPQMRAVLKLVESALTSPITVLLQGETGSGKELIARAIHYNGPRKDRPFVAVNCAALTETLLESELFGHKKGSFTGALSDKKGIFEVADGGTVFLDEIGETSPALQVKLLRVLQDREILPVGDTVSHPIDVRVISATNRNLEEESAQGTFRPDLFYRLNAFTISLPPLRERPGDVAVLTARILQATTERFKKPVKGISPAAVERLNAYTWPGNVRELGNEIERAVALVGEGEMIEVTHLSAKLLEPKIERVVPEGAVIPLREARDQFERNYIRNVLDQHGGNASQASKVLGISRVMLQKKIKAFGLREKA